jgi:hypothetical protein
VWIKNIQNCLAKGRLERSNVQTQGRREGGRVGANCPGPQLESKSLKLSRFIELVRAFLKLKAPYRAISYPEPSLSGSGHTGLKNDPDWSIHKLLDPYPLWLSHARPIWVNTIYFALFCLKICLFWRIFCCFSSEKVVKGLRSWFMHTWIHLGKIQALRYGNNSYSWFTLSEYWWEWWHMSLIYYIGVLLLKRNSSVQDLQAYTYARTVFIQDLGFFIEL